MNVVAPCKDLLRSTGYGEALLVCKQTSGDGCWAWAVQQRKRARVWNDLYYARIPEVEFLKSKVVSFLDLDHKFRILNFNGIFRYILVGRFFDEYFSKKMLEKNCSKNCLKKRVLNFSVEARYIKAEEALRVHV